MSTELSTQLAILRQRLEESQAINHWKPEPGDTLLGILRGLKPAKGPFGQGHMASGGDRRRGAVGLVADRLPQGRA
jgi:hypothetical protein